MKKTIFLSGGRRLSRIVSFVHTHFIDPTTNMRGKIKQILLTAISRSINESVIETNDSRLGVCMVVERF